MTRVAFVTNEALRATGGPVSSDIALVRRELLLPAAALHGQGHAARVLSLPGVTAEHLREIFAEVDHCVFGSLIPSDKGDGGPFTVAAQAYNKLLSGLPRRLPVSFCLSEDSFDSRVFADFYGSMATRAHSWLVSSAAIRQRVEMLSRRPVVVCPEPVEMRPAVARVQRRGLRARLGAALARRAGVGLEPWRVHLLWFGHPRNVRSLTALLPELEALARDIPLHLECVSQPVTELTSRVTPRGAEFSLPFRISFVPWSLEATQAALERCDAVLLPQPAEERARRATTNNRLIDSLQAGRFAIAHPLPAYDELREYAWVGDSFSDGVRWLLREPDEALERVRRGQEYVSENHSLAAIGGFWQAALGLRAAP